MLTVVLEAVDRDDDNGKKISQVAVTLKDEFEFDDNFMKRLYVSMKDQMKRTREKA